MASGPGCSGPMGSDSVCMGWLVTRAALKASEMTREAGAAQEALVAWVSKAWAAQGSQISSYPGQHRWELLPGRGSSKSYGCRWLRLTRCRTTNERLGIIKPEELANIESGISRKNGQRWAPQTCCRSWAGNYYFTIKSCFIVRDASTGREEEMVSMEDEEWGAGERLSLSRGEVVDQDIFLHWCCSGGEKPVNVSNLFVHLLHQGQITQKPL